MLNELSQLTQVQIDGISIVLIVALIAAFVAAFKIMEMIFETILVSVLSGVFYLVLRYIQGGPVNINDLLMFSVLGSSLYMAYSLVSSLYSIGATVIPIPYRLAKAVVKPFEYAWKKLKQQVGKTRSDRNVSTREVVLDNQEENED
ncbi:MAG: hypothetical protein ABEJ95_02765 [Candidatus Nanohalobium sp.]